MRQAIIKRKLLFFLTVGLLSLETVCAAEDVIELKARASPARVTLGDEIKFVLQIEHPNNLSVTPPSLKTNLAPFEIKSVQPEPPRYVRGRVKETFRIVLTVFQLGDLKIPPVSLRYSDSRGQGGAAVSDPILIKVVSVPKRVSDKEDIRPIKGPVSVDMRLFRNFVLAIVAVCLAVFLAVRIFLLRRRRLIDLESSKPPHERAVLELERLRNSGLLEAGEVKGFYSELADILRRYIQRRFSVETFDKTTIEIVGELKEKEFAATVLDKTKQVLEKSDLVKFAKLVPKRSLADELVTQLVQIVEETKPVVQQQNEKR